jgi:ribosome-binding factor A
MLEKIKEQNWLIRRTLGGRIRNQLKIVPELEFFIDDSLEYIENIDNLLSK